MEALRFENRPGLQTALATGCAAAGAVLAFGFRHFDSSGLTNSLAGFLLGLLLLGIGAWSFTARGRQSIEIDPELRRIVIEDTNRTGTSQRIIPFGDIVETKLGYLGKKSNHVNFYYIALRLANGENYALFAPGRFFEGSSERGVMEYRRERLEEYLRQH